MSEPHEPSYYEIALTNRQVMVAFVVLLAVVLVSFLSGVWVGREGGPLRADEPQLGAPSPEETEVAQLEDFQFFSEGERPPSTEPLRKPDLSRLAAEDEEAGGSTLAEDVGAAPPPASADAREGRRPSREERQAARRREAAERDTEPEPVLPPPSPSPPPPALPLSPPPPAASSPPPPQPAASAPPPPAEEGYIIQVFSTRDKPQALRVLGQLTSAGYQAFMSSVEVDGQAMHRVRLGPFAERSRAESTAAKVNEQFKLDTWITAASN